MAEEANSGDRFCVAFLVNTGFFGGWKWLNIVQILNTSNDVNKNGLNRAKIDQVKDHPTFGHIRIPCRKFHISSIK